MPDLWISAAAIAMPFTAVPLHLLSFFILQLSSAKPGVYHGSPSHVIQHFTANDHRPLPQKSNFMSLSNRAEEIHI
jgi:hypothetical protein